MNNNSQQNKIALDISPILIGVSNPDEFFHRFSASSTQKETYIPLFLSICYSSYGEIAPSFGIFTKKNQKQLYTVYGDECSIWDFNGQFLPELTSIDLLENQTEQQLGFVDGDDRFNTQLKKCLYELKKLNVFPKSKDNPEIQLYLEFINSELITQLPIQQKEMHLFQSQYHDYSDEGITFHAFQIETTWGVKTNLFINHNMKLSCDPEMAKILTKKHKEIKLFINELQGSIELQHNIFIDPKKIKPHP